MGFIFLVFDVASSLDVPIGTPQCIQCILRGLTSALLCAPFIFAHHKKCLYALDGLFITEIVHNFHSGYFDCRCSFQTVFESYYCITC